MQIKYDQQVTKDLIAELHSQTKHLSKLYILYKVDKSRQIKAKELENDIKAIFDRESYPVQKELRVPEHLICTISGDIMFDPVTLESGRTYERSSIEMLFMLSK